MTKTTKNEIITPVLRTTLENMDKNIKYWIKQGFKKFTVEIADTNFKINIEVK